jgi:hypothetical protein
MAGATVDGLPSEWTRQRAGCRLDLLHYWISDRQRIVHSGHIRSEVLRKTRVKKKAFSQSLRCGGRASNGRIIRIGALERRGISGTAAIDYKQKDHARDDSAGTPSSST